MKVMNKGLQIYMIEKDLDKAGVDPQTVDIKARVDPALTYPENKENFQKYIVNEACMHSELNPENENLHYTTRAEVTLATAAQKNAIYGVDAVSHTETKTETTEEEAETKEGGISEYELAKKVFKTPFQLDVERIIESYLEAGRLMGKNLDYEFKLGLHVLLGNILRDHRMMFKAQMCDCRIHLYLVRDTSAGKGLVATLLKNLAKKIGIKWSEITDATDAGLIGTIEPIKGVYVPKYGILKDVDVLVYREGASIKNISQTRHSGDIMNKINLTIDEPCPREINKTMAKGVIKYDTCVSWFITTYPVTVTGREEQTGFYQRFLFSFKLRTLDDAFDNMSWLLDNVGEDETKILEQHLLPLIERLKKIQEHGKFNFDWSNVTEELKEAGKQLKESFQSLSDVDRAKKFVERKTIQLLKLACHHAALDLREKLNAQDIHYALGIIKKSIEELDEYFAIFSGDVDYNRVLKYLKRSFDAGATEIPLRKIYRGMKGVDVRKIVYKLEGEGRVEIIEKKTTTKPRKIVKILDIY